MLGLAASHLTNSANVDYSSQALGHRVRAIQLLNDQLARPCRSQADGDALFAAAMVLTQQAAFMDDAMVELLVMTRGCDLIARAVMPSFADSAFRSFTMEGHVGAVLAFLRDQGACERSDEAVSGFAGSVERLRPLCEGQTELEYLAALQRVVQMANGSSFDGKEPKTTPTRNKPRVG